jgi:hypothetical protein
VGDLADVEHHLIRTGTVEGRNRRVSAGRALAARRGSTDAKRPKRGGARKVRLCRTRARLRREHKHGFPGLGHDAMSEEFKDITNWAAVVGQWDFANARRVYTSPEDPQWPYGICVSNVRFSEGTARARIRFPEVDVEVAGRLLFGYRSLAHPYLGIGLGGAGREYGIYEYDPAMGWRGVAFAGSRKNLRANHPYKLSVLLQGQRLLLEVDSVQVLEHVLEAPLPQGQFGLFAWGTTNVEFTSTSVSEEPGTVFVVMQFSEPYQDLYTDVITKVVNDEKYNLRAYHAGEVFGPGVILEDIVRGIIDARIVIAEITPPNQNVFYELGYAHALKKPTILLAERGKELPFDVSGYRCLFYDNTIGGKTKIEEGLRKHLDAILRVIRT